MNVMVALSDFAELVKTSIAEKVDIKLPIGENHYPRYEQPAEIKYDRDEANFDRILDLYETKKNEVLRQNGKIIF